jgi:hypothetical protein
MDEQTRNQIRKIANLDKKRIIKENTEVSKLVDPSTRLSSAFNTLFGAIKTAKPLVEENKELSNKLRELVIDRLATLATLVEETFKEEEKELDE